MKNSLLSVLFSFSILLFLSNPSLAADNSDDINKGQAVFSNNCTACHAGGNNVIVNTKTLQKDVLEENGMYKVEAIVYQVTNGKNAMPAFGGRLSEEEIDNVAQYVLNKSAVGWED